MHADGINVIVDDRERESDVMRFLSDRATVSFTVRRLAVGDYLVDDRLIFERKTLKDFAVSIVDGRLFRQAVKLANSTYKAVLILEGTGRDLSHIGLGREAMQGALIAISLVLGITVLRSMGPWETAGLMIYAARQISSSARHGLQRHGYQPKGKRSRQLFVLQSLPGVGLERAGRLLDAFGSVEAVIAASPGELQAVDGIGAKIAERIRWAVTERLQPYRTTDEFPL